MQFVLCCPGTMIFFLSTSSLIIACNWSPWADRELHEWRKYAHLCPLGCPQNTGPVFGTVISGTEGVTEDVGTMRNTEHTKASTEPFCPFPLSSPTGAVSTVPSPPPCTFPVLHCAHGCWPSQATSIQPGYWSKSRGQKEEKTESSTSAPGLVQVLAVHLFPSPSNPCHQIMVVLPLRHLGGPLS